MADVVETETGYESLNVVQGLWTGLFKEVPVKPLNL